MSEMKANVLKSTELQQRLRYMALSHMDSRRKDDKDIYFSMIGYDINM